MANEEVRRYVVSIDDEKKVVVIDRDATITESDRFLLDHYWKEGFKTEFYKPTVKRAIKKDSTLRLTKNEILKALEGNEEAIKTFKEKETEGGYPTARSWYVKEYLNK